ncbi:MAG: hypothetical protein AAFQ83_24005 [Bacteroidota bacterium]
MDPIYSIISQQLLATCPAPLSHVLLYGSQLQPSQVDEWSDIDLAIILAEGVDIDPVKCIQWVKQLGTIVAKETHVHSHRMVLRLVMEFSEQILLLDLNISKYEEGMIKWKHTHEPFRILHGAPLPSLGGTKSNVPIASAFDFPQEKVDRIWYLFFFCAKKFLRRDPLIGMHLLCGLQQEYLVMEMEARDQIHQTNIHRWGYGEKLPSELFIQPTYLDKPSRIKHYLLTFAQLFDLRLSERYDDYQSRYSAFEHFLMRRQSD